MYVGKNIVTSNVDVKSLRPGSRLEVTAAGVLKVTFVAPEPITFKAGDKVYIKSKARYARIVRMTNVDGLSEQLPAEGEQLYVQDGTFVVRVADESDIQKLG